MMDRVVALMAGARFKGRGARGEGQGARGGSPVVTAKNTPYCAHSGSVTQAPAPALRRMGALSPHIVR